MRPVRSTVFALTVAAAAGAGPAAAQEEHGRHAHGPADGAVHFPVSCRPEVRPDFHRAVAVLHSFGYEEARLAFLAIADRDPACGMAHWGVAMTYWHALWVPPTPDEFAAGRAAAERALRVGAATERERMYIAAINAFYADADRRDHRARALAYRAAMERIVAEFPDDDEAKILHALAVLAAAPPSDTTYAAQKQGAEMLNRLLPAHPRHPGIAHYTIHAFDNPRLAALALPAARSYAELAPESPHALHMPTHIFTRLGLWDESIAANLACARAADAWVARTHPGAASFETLHCQDYLAYAYLQRGDDERARLVLEKVIAARRFDDPNFAVGYAMLAVPARYVLERRDWQAAARLEPPAAALPWEHYRYGESILYFARAIGAARGGEIARARAALARLEELHREVADAPPAGPYDWAARVGALWSAAAGWVAFADGRPNEAVRLLTAAAEQEETVGKHPVTPGATLPARELLGDVLQALDRPADALAAYEAALAQAPRRFNGLLGAARAARAAGERERARAYYEELLALAGSSATRRGPLAEARTFVSSQTGSH